MIFSYAKSVISNWQTKGFIFLICLSLIVLFIVIIFHIGKKGKYNELPSFRKMVKDGIEKYIYPGGRNSTGNVGNMRNMKNVGISRENMGNNGNKYDPYKDNTSKNPGESKPERRCREILENIFNVPFNKCRPDVLKNPITRDYNLEIDCYNADLRLGLEYNGKQHYEFIPYFHKNKEAFYNQKYRDEIKRKLCKEKGIRLIEVPYTVKYKDLEKYIILKLKEI